MRVFGPVMFEGFGRTETLIPILVKRPSDYLKSDGSFYEEAVRAAGKAVGVVRVGMAAARTQGKRTKHGKPQGAVGDDQPEAGGGTGRAPWGGGEARSTAEAG